MLLLDIRHYLSLELPAQIQVFEPDQIGISFHFLDNRLHIGYSGEYWRYETHGTDARLIDLTHRFQALQQVDVAHDKIGFCAYHNLGVAPTQFFEKPTSAAKFLFIRVVAIRH